MAVYKMTNESLAEYISNTHLIVSIDKVFSNEGYRVENRKVSNPSRYSCKIDNIIGVGYGNPFKPVEVTSDVFLCADDTIRVVCYIPGFKFQVRTLETSKYYGKGEKLTFGCFKFSPIQFDYEISVDELNTYRDFEHYINKYAGEVTKRINIGIKELNGDCDWRFEGINPTIKFKVVKTNI